MLGGYSDEAIEKPLRDYQTFAAEWLLDRLYDKEWPGAGLLLDPGLGKTRTVLTVIEQLRALGHVNRVLVVAPLRPVYSVWPKEVKRWGFPFSTAILHKQHNKALSWGRFIDIVNFEGVAKINHVKDRWDLVIIDESAFVKTWSSNRTKAMRKLRAHVPQMVILNGTPVDNALADLHAQHYMVDKGEALGKTVTAFRNRFCRMGGWMGREWVVRGGVGPAIYKAIQDTCLRMKAEDHLDMPELIVNDVWAKMPENATKHYRRLKRELYTLLESGADIMVGNAAAAYSKCRQFANGTVYSGEGDDRESHEVHKEKISALSELHEELSGKPLLVFYHFTQDRERIQKLTAFKDAPVLAGGMKIEDVERLLDEWNEGKHHTLLAQWQAASHGLNMQGCCNDVACFGIVDKFGTYDQAIRRVYRQGVTGEQVRIHRILTEDTVEEVMLERLNGKLGTHQELTDALKTHARG